jgi:hypothetical protein
VKPRYDAISYEATKLLEKAAALELRIQKELNAKTVVKIALAKIVLIAKVVN